MVYAALGVHAHIEYHSKKAIVENVYLICTYERNGNQSDYHVVLPYSIFI
jgi:hypothetical protein